MTIDLHHHIIINAYLAFYSYSNYLLLSIYLSILKLNTYYLLKLSLKIGNLCNKYDFIWEFIQ